MKNEWAEQDYEDVFNVPYDIGVPIQFMENASGRLLLSYDLDGNVYIHFATDRWMGPVFRLPGWLQFAN